MPWAVVERIDEETGDEFVHIVPFIRVQNEFITEAEALAFAAERDLADDCITNEDHDIIGVHKGHTLSPDCVCNPKPMDSDPYCFVHNAAN